MTRAWAGEVSGALAIASATRGTDTARVRQEGLTAEISTISFPITTTNKQQREWAEMAQPRPSAMHLDRRVADIPARALKRRRPASASTALFTELVALGSNPVGAYQNLIR
jgi:hypothetical protein